MTKILTLMTLALALSLPAMANNHLPKRIKEGVKSGQLTPAEQEQLKTQRDANKAEIKAKKEELTADGALNKDDKKQLKQMRADNRKEMSKKVHDLKNNADTTKPVDATEPAPNAPTTH